MKKIINWFKIHFTKNKIERPTHKPKPWAKIEQTSYGTRYYYEDGTYLEIWDLIPSPATPGSYITKTEE